MLKQEYPQLQLEVVGPFGPGDYEPYQRLVQRHGITDVRFVGYVSPAELPHFYRKADIFCAPSLGFESFGIVLLEAMASGLPIVASDIVGYRSVMTDGQEGLLAPPGQARPLAGALHHLLDKPWLRWEMGQRGRLKASHYSWDEIIDQILAVYIDALELKTKIRRQKLGQAEAALSSYCHV
jgi:phosphatidylinositol alpha-mannosyltransferase